MRVRRGLVLVSVLLFSGTVSAQSMTDLFLAAATDDPALASNDAQYRAAKERVTEAQAARLPSLAFVGTGSRSKFIPESGEPNSSSSFYHTNQATLQLTQPVFRPGLSWAVDSAHAQQTAAQAQLDAAEADLFVRLVTAYCDVLTAREERLALERQRQATQEQVLSAKRSFEVGTVAITDVRDAEAKHDLVVAQERSAENDVADKQETLRQLAGGVDITLRVLPRRAPDPQVITDPLDRLTEQAVEQNPIAEQAQLLVQAAQDDVKKAFREHYPTLDLALSYGTDETNGTPINPEPVHGRTATAQLNFNLPLYAGGGTNAKVREAKALVDKAKADLESAHRTIAKDLRESYYGLKSALEQVEALQTAERSTDAAVQANLKGYKVGSNTSADLLNAESDYFQAHRDLMKAKIQARLNYTKLLVVMGHPWNEAVDDLNRLLVPESEGTDEGTSAAFLEHLGTVASGHATVPE